MDETFRRERPQEQLEFTGERLTSAATGQVEIEHLHRYFLARDFSRGRDVLDIASGEGYGAAILAQVARSVVGIDISDQAVRFAARNYQSDNLSFGVGDARNIPLPDAAFDVVVSFETIEHLLEQEQFLSEIKRVLRPGGLLVMSSPDRDVYSGGRDTANPFHVRELTATEFTGLLSRHFVHVAASGQRCFLGSAVLPLLGVPAGVRSFERRSEALVEGAGGPARAVYIFALASDNPIEGAATSIYVHSPDVDGPAHRVAAARAELLQAQAALAAANGRLAALVPDEAGETARQARFVQGAEAVVRASSPTGDENIGPLSHRMNNGTVPTPQGGSVARVPQPLSEAESGREAVDTHACANRGAGGILSGTNVYVRRTPTDPHAKEAGISAGSPGVRLKMRVADLDKASQGNTSPDEADTQPEALPQQTQVRRTTHNGSGAGSLMDQFRIGTREPLFFMHIPKTAGMSMRLYLGEQYHFKDICPVARWQGLLGLEKTLHSFRLVQGHFRYNLRALVASDARTLVMLREPLRRTVSALRHLQRDPSFHQDHHLAKDLTLSEMIRHPGLMRNQQNVQAYYLCASRAPADVSAYLQRELPQNPNADAGYREEPPTLQLATERLASIDFIGLTEDIAAVVATMALEMNYHPPLYFPFINEDPTRIDPLHGMTDQDIGILREYNDIDLQIYDFAKHLIERRAFERSMRQLLSSKMYTVPPGSFEILTSGIMPGSGWYAPEEQDGMSWRWTGPGRYFTIEVPLRQDASYRLIMAFGGLRPIGQGDLAAEVNDVPVGFDLLAEGRGYRCELVISEAVLAQSSGFCRIRFDTRETTQLKPPDIRALGVSVRRIVFECLESALSVAHAITSSDAPAINHLPGGSVSPQNIPTVIDLPSLGNVSSAARPMGSDMLQKTLAMLTDVKPGTYLPDHVECYDPEEIDALGYVLRRLVYGPSSIRRLLQQKYGATLTRADFYSEIPTITDLERSFAAPSLLILKGIFPDNAAMIAELDRLMTVSHEFDPPKKSNRPGEYAWEGGPFSYSDAMAYYAVIRTRQPRTIVEIGSGWSTLIAQMACAKNGGGRIVCVEPYPNEFLKALPGIELVERRVQDIETGFFNTMLQDGDVLFIDSTHTVKHDGDCLHIYLRILPAVEANIAVHVHDIHLPDTLPLSQMRDNQIFWNEQYLLYAYMCSNRRTRTIYGSRYHSQNNPDMLDRFMHGRYKAGGASFWFEQGRML